MKYFISCDWGTSSFRLRLIDATTQAVLAETLSLQGIAATYDLWKQQTAVDRFLFYRNYLAKQIELLSQHLSNKLDNVPLIISGMASSAIGMKELPYKQIPFAIIAADLPIYVEEASEIFPHKIIIVSGACSANDVMRGEETILAGCDHNKERQLFILPGTHSKHATIENGILQSVKTFMTGELFALLSKKSILSASVEKENNIAGSLSFINGITDACSGSLLNNIFHVRTNTLLNLYNTKNNYAYLSGLLIGEEVKSISDKNITIVSSGELQKLYTIALTTINKNISVLQQDADKALIKGQTIIYNNHL